MATRNARERMITGEQVKKIHSLKSALAMDDEVYRGALFQAFGVDSSKELNFSQAEEVIRYFEREAIAEGVWEIRQGADRHKHLKGRNGYATPAQLGFIESLWRDVTRADDEAEAAQRLRTFLQRQAGVSDLRFLRGTDAGKVIEALKAMKRQGRTKENLKR